MTDRLKAFFDNARTETFEYKHKINGKDETVKITVRETLGVDHLDQQVSRRLIREQWYAAHEGIKVMSDREWNRCINVVAFLFRTVKVVGNLPNGLKLPDMEDGDSMWAQYKPFLTLPSGLMTQWEEALNKVNRPAPSPEVVPGDGKNTTSS